MQSPVNTEIAVDMALSFSFIAHIVFRRSLKEPVFDFVDFSCDCLANKLHKEKCLVKSCGMTWSQAYINKSIKSRGSCVSEPGGFSLRFFAFEQLCNAVHMCVHTQNTSMDLCTCTGPVFEEDHDLKACSNPRSSLCCFGSGACLVSVVQKRNPEVSLELVGLSARLEFICFNLKVSFRFCCVEGVCSYCYY